MTRPATILAILIAAAACGLSACNVAADAGSPAAPAGTRQAATPAAPASLQAVLAAALDDERKAEATYAAVLAAHGPVRQFVNIIEAERRHASRLADVMTARGMAIPANPYTAPMTAPATLAAACAEGVTAERENIALYDRLIPTIADAEARQLLTELQAASRDRHLPAFERCGQGRGEGRGEGRGPGGGQGGGPGGGQHHGQGPGHGRT